LARLFRVSPNPSEAARLEYRKNPGTCTPI
jgi:hypothetical protein